MAVVGVLVGRRMAQFVEGQRCVGWGGGGGVYEPETEAFGGPNGMDVAHDVFCADSRAALVEAGGPVREGAVSCCSPP